MKSFSFDKHLYTCLLIFTSGLFSLFTVQCWATNTGTFKNTSRNGTVLTRNRCPGIPTDFDVNVQPASDAVAAPPTQTICSGSQNAAIILTSNVPGASFLRSTKAIPPVSRQALEIQTVAVQFLLQRRQTSQPSGVILPMLSSFCRSLFRYQGIPRCQGKSRPDIFYR